MSLFIGNDSSGDAKLVISKGVVSENTLKDASTLQSSIIFNSKLPYLAVDYIETTNITTSKPLGGWGFPSDARITRHIYQFTADDLALLRPDGTNFRYMLFFLDNTQVISFGGGLQNGSSVGLDDEYGPYLLASATNLYNTWTWDMWVVSSTEIYLYIHTPDTYVGNSIEIVAFPFDMGGGTSGTTFPFAQTIEIGNGDMLFDGVSIFKEKFLVQGSLNLIDKNITFFNNTYQLINSEATNGDSISLSSSNGVTSVRLGDKTILSSDYSYYPLVYNEQDAQYLNVSGVYYRTGYSGDYYYISGFNFESGGIYVINKKVIGTQIQNAKWHYESYIVKADNTEYETTFGVVPGITGGLMLVAIKQQTTSDSIGIALKLVGGTGQYPIDNIYWGPYDMEFTYYRVA